MKRILMIAYHFPPLAGSSGIQRTLRFVQHLPKFDWQPLVLTANLCAYERTSEDLCRDIPTGVTVRRAFAIDTSRHLSIRGRYIAAMARPDRWISWKYDGVRQGLKMIKEFKPDIIWSTYPIATAHLIGAELNRRTGIPWVADFRDPMAQQDYPKDPLTWRQFHDIEVLATEKAALSLFTTPGAADIYRQRYPAATKRIHVLENGYDEESFADVERDLVHEPLNPGKITFLHSGIVYPSERDPTQLFLALARLKSSNALAMKNVKVRFRAPVHDALLLELVNKHGLENCVEVLPPIPYRQALGEMLNADVLLVMQASNCNQQIPAKLYEYVRANRPILGLTDPDGDTAGVLRKFGCGTITRLDSAEDIAAQLSVLLSGQRAPSQMNTDVQQRLINGASRLGRTRSLVELMEQCRPGCLQ